MQTEQIPLDETNCFSSFFIDYISQKPELTPFYNRFPSIDNFKETIKRRNFDSKKRKVLVDVLKRQYDNLETASSVKKNIEKLGKENTYTVTTGHQLNIFTGPLYFIYKIVTVINACKRLKERYPEHEFVPVYWMASEDHDFDEINHFYFDRKKYEWETDQTGAVGRFDPKKLLKLVEQLPNQANFFKDAYNQSSLVGAGRHYVDHLFKKEGLVAVDADGPDLKSLFVPAIEKDVLEHVPNQLVPKDTQKLEALGYKTQVNCREINFFYLDDGVRERIEQQGDHYVVLNTDLSFSEEEIMELIHVHPEKFSPNVILRPLYQETILPNLAYVGGPSEVVYWLQMKSMFDHFQTPFPLLMPRNFALIVSKKEANKWEKTSLSPKDLFLDAHEAHSKWVKTHSHNDLSFSDQIKEIASIYDALASKTEQVDPTLNQHMEALKMISSKKLEKAEKKLIRAEKRKHQEKENQINDVKEVLFPDGGLQERRDNFLNFYVKNHQIIQQLLNTFDPFDYRMYLLFE